MTRLPAPPLARPLGSRRVAFLQHAPGEGPGGLLPWAATRGYPAVTARLHRGEPLPRVDDFDWLVVLGGPMGVHDPAPAPWLAAELALIEAAVGTGRTVVGVCLGAQLVAHVLGAPVRRHVHAEVGWHDVEPAPDAAADPRLAALLDGVPDPWPVLHWHVDTFDLPRGAGHLFRSVGCAHQGFAWGGRADGAPQVLGVQFHPEMRPATVRRLARTEAALLRAGGPHVQAAAELLAVGATAYARAHAAFGGVLDRLGGPAPAV